MTTKEVFRRRLTLVKQGLPEGQIARQSRAVVRLLEKWPRYRAAKAVFFYCPLKREVQIQKLMAAAIAEGKKVFLPVCNPQRGTMKAAALRSLKDLRKGPYGILQPKPSGHRPVRHEDLDILLVPGLGFDKKGNRLGRGKGYYDKFLRSWAGEGVKVWIGFRAQILPAVPVGPRDVPMDYICHSGGILRAARRKKT